MLELDDEQIELIRSILTSTCTRCGKTWVGLPDERGLCAECEWKDNDKTWDQEEIDAAREKARELRLLFGWEQQND